MAEQHVFVLADQTLNSVVQQIKDDQWELAIPEWIAIGGNTSREGLTLRTLINYHAYDDMWVPDMLAGRTMAEVGVDKWRDEDLLGDDPRANFAAIVDKAVAAAQALTDDQLDAMAHLSFGDFKIREYFWQISSFRTFRVYEIAKLIGIDPTLPEELVQGVWDELSPHFEEWRAMGVFGPAVEVPADAPLQTRLLGASGRAV